MVHEKVMVYLDDMSIDKSLGIVYNIIKDDRSEPMVIKTAAEIVGIRLGDKAPHSRLVGSSKHDKKNNGGKKMKRIISLALILILTLICGVQIAADSAETYAACNHNGYTFDTVKSATYTNIDKYDHKVNCVIEHACINCGKTWTEVKEYITSHYFIDVGEEVGDGWKECTECGAFYLIS